MTQPICYEQSTTSQSLTERKISLVLSPGIVKELGNHVATLTKKHATGGSSEKTEEKELEYILENSSTLSSEELKKLIDQLSAQMRTTSSDDIDQLLQVIESLPQEEQAKAMALLQQELPQAAQAKFPTKGSVKEQIAFLEKYMSSLSLTERRQFVLSLVKAQGTNSPENSGPTADGIVGDINYLLTHLSSLSAEEFQQLVAKLLVEIGVFLSQIQQGSVKITNDEVQVAQELSKNAQNQAKKVSDEIKKEEEEQKKAESGFWGFLGKIFGNKWVQIILTAIIGLLFCETPLGFVMLAGMIALQASGALDKMTAGLANAMGGSAVAQFFSSVIITTLLTGGAGLAEGLGQAAISGLAKGATEAVAEDVGQVAAKETENVAAKASEDAAKSTEASATKDASESADKDESWMTKKGRFFSNSTAMILVQNLTSTNLIFNFLTACGMDKNTATWLAAVLNILVSLAIMGGALKGSTSTLIDLTANLSKIGTAVKVGAGLVQGTTAAGTGALNIHTGVINKDISDIQTKLAPYEANIPAMEAFSRIFAQMIQITNNDIASSIKNESSIFSIDLAAGWREAAESFQITA